MEIPSEPIRKERIRQKLIRSLGGESQILGLQLRSRPPQKNKKNGGPFTIVDATLIISMIIRRVIIITIIIRTLTII